MSLTLYINQPSINYRKSNEAGRVDWKAWTG